MYYQQKPVKVRAFQITRDVRIDAPVWFEKAIESGKADVDESLVDGYVRVYGCTVRTAEGKMNAKIGDYIIMEPDGTLSVCKKNRFERLYEEV